MTASLAGGWDTHIHVFSGVARQGSHYTLAASTLAMWQVAAAPHGLMHAVLVQPSVYGTDNAALLTALRQSNGEHRAVVVIDADITDDELAVMHALGVRGVRLNLVSPVGQRSTNVPRLAARVKELGWHVQFYARPSDLPMIAKQQRAGQGIVVLDHFAGLAWDGALSTSEARALAALAANGAWIKCSAPYRLGMARPFSQAKPMITEALRRFSGRVLWGSDWPHTWYLESQQPSRGAAPDFEELLRPFADVFADPKVRQDVMVHAPQRLYQ
jgi:predicted TIM-barrel fold metal-dependent hydrolase